MNTAISQRRNNFWIFSAVLLIAALILGALLGSVMTAEGWSPLGAHIGKRSNFAAPANINTSVNLSTGFSGVASQVIPEVVTVETMSRVRPQPIIPPFFENPFGDLFNFQWPGRQNGQGNGQGQPNSPQQGPPSARGVLEPHALGSGVIVSPDGYILTNNHVVAGADKIQVTLSDNRGFTAKLIGTDAPSDIAVLKIDGRDLPAITIGDSNKVQVGDVVLAIGNPLGVGETVTMGIISARGRSTDSAGSGSYEDFLQTDASINQGNSGGALVDVRGQLVGIPSQILSQGGGNIGIGFAIPSAMAHSVMDQLIHGGKVHRGRLGVQIGLLTPELASKFGYKGNGGALVEDVEPGQPADRAGVKAGDIITEYQGQHVEDSGQLRNLVAQTAPGTTIKFKVWRNNSEMDMTATLGEMEAGQAAGPGASGGSSSALSGVQVQNLTPAIRQSLNLPASAQGVVILSVDPNSNAGVAQLRQGDVIQEIDRQPISNVSDFNSAMQKAGNNSVLLRVWRAQQGSFYVVVQAQ